MNLWHSGSGECVPYRDIIKDIKKHSKNNGTVFVGTDSQVVKNQCIFSTAICLHGATDQQGGKYFFKKTKFKKSKYPTLVERITSEVQSSIQIAFEVLRFCPLLNIEIHVDVSPSNKKEKSSKFADMLIGYAKGVGFECKIKPDAFAATTIADKHTK